MYRWFARFKIWKGLNQPRIKAFSIFKYSNCVFVCYCTCTGNRRPTMDLKLTVRRGIHSRVRSIAASWSPTCRWNNRLCCDQNYRHLIFSTICRYRHPSHAPPHPFSFFFFVTSHPDPQHSYTKKEKHNYPPTFHPSFIYLHNSFCVIVCCSSYSLLFFFSHHLFSTLS